jgi:Ner family transcriptional regulator
MDDTNTVRQEGKNHSDWHPADVQAALKKRGVSLAGLSVANGYHPTAAGKALRRSWPALELVIAQAIGRSPEEIWPNRYAAGRDDNIKKGSKLGDGAA